MKRYVRSTAVAVGLVALAGYSQAAKADTFTVTVLQDTGNAPVEGTATPDVQTGSVNIQSTTVDGSYLSPYNFNNNGTQNTPYIVIAEANTGSGSVTYNLNGANFFQFLWGSPDTYNAVTFYAGLNGTGNQLGTFTGADLSCFGAPGTGCTDTEFALTQFVDNGGLGNPGGAIGSVVLSDPTVGMLSGTPGLAAFEFGTVLNGQQVTETPIPGAAALFAGGLGLLGLVGRRRRKAKQRLALSAA